MGRQESPRLIERKGQVDTDAQEILSFQVLYHGILHKPGSLR